MNSVIGFALAMGSVLFDRLRAGGVLERVEDACEGGNVARRHAREHASLERHEMGRDLAGERPAAGREIDHERSPVARIRPPLDQAALLEAVEDARQRRALVCERAMELGDGWVPLLRGQPDIVRQVRCSPGWPARPMTVVRITWMLVAERGAAVMADAEQAYEIVRNTATLKAPPSFEEFLAREVIGTPEECRARIEELEQAGIDYHLVTFADEGQQERVARLLLPRL